jgi:flagellar motor switch protein FliN
MSGPESRQEIRLDSAANLVSVLDQWTESLAVVFESMAGQRPEVRWRVAAGSLTEIGVPTGPGAEDEVLWWEQPFQIEAGAVFWVAAPRATWEYAGTLTLKAAGLETVEIPEVKSTWFELLGQSLGTMARAAGALVGREVTLAAGLERAPDPEMREWGSVSLHFPEAALAPLVVAMNPQMAGALVHAGRAPADTGQPVEAIEEREEPRRAAAPSRTFDLLMDVDLPVSISFGKTQLPLKDVLKLTTGSIVELNRGVNDQVEVLVNHCLIARGEVVVVEGNYGVRIQEIIKRQERLRSVQ